MEFLFYLFLLNLVSFLLLFILFFFGTLLAFVFLRKKKEIYCCLR